MPKTAPTKKGPAVIRNFLTHMVSGLGGFAQAAVELDFFLAEAIEANDDLREVDLRDINGSGMVLGSVSRRR